MSQGGREGKGGRVGRKGERVGRVGEEREGKGGWVWRVSGLVWRDRKARGRGIKCVCFWWYKE